MFDSLTGTLNHLAVDPLSQAPYTVIQVQGIAYQLVCLPRHYQSLLPFKGETVHIYCKMVIRQNPDFSMQLFGFQTRVERDLFSILLAASGVGPKNALALLDCLGVEGLVQAMWQENHKPLTQAKGIGPKLAQKLVLELKEKLTTWSKETSELGSPRTAMRSANSSLESESKEAYISPSLCFPASALNDAEVVLVSLGYNNEEITACFQALHTLETEQLPKAEQGNPTQKQEWSAELLLRYSLKWLALNPVH